MFLGVPTGTEIYFTKLKIFISFEKKSSNQNFFNNSSFECQTDKIAN